MSISITAVTAATVGIPIAGATVGVRKAHGYFGTATFSWACCLRVRLYYCLFVMSSRSARGGIWKHFISLLALLQAQNIPNTDIDNDANSKPVVPM